MRPTFYITTAINYTNGPPHLGHAYEAIVADVIARFYRINGYDVFFLTGTDEHGKKIAQKAEQEGITPIELCNRYVAKFKELNERLMISNDYFIRTTDPDHVKRVQQMFQKLYEKGELEHAKYVGWYNVREERFVPDHEAEENGFKDPETGKPLERMEEDTYFFKLRKYQNRLIDYITTHPEFIQPETRRNEILSRLQEPINDLSVTRTTFDWGIPLLNDPEHVLYVWVDALMNYLTGIQYPDGENARYWPADVHIIGKDIIWFHTVVWPILLMALDIPLPKQVFAHGFIKSETGQKMSKTLGNIIDPHDLLDKFGVDAVRYFFVREGKFGEDIGISEEAIAKRYNGELADEIGNLLNRVTALIKRYNNGKIPDVEPEEIFSVEELRKKIADLFEKRDISTALTEVYLAGKEISKYISMKEPWKMEAGEERDKVLRTAVEAVAIIAHFYYPFIPRAAEKILELLKVERRTLPELSYHITTPGTELETGKILFKKIDMNTLLEPVQKLDLRVAKILEVKNHPNADKLYLLTIDLGSETRQLVAGLKAYYSPEELMERKIVVLANLKPSKLRGEVSQGMLLAAENDGKVKLLDPGAAEIGTQVVAKGLPARPVPKLKITEFEKVPLEVKNGKIWSSGRPLVASNIEIRVDIEDGATVH